MNRQDTKDAKKGIFSFAGSRQKKNFVRFAPSRLMGF